MLFNSVEFLTVFLPLTMLGFFLIGRRSQVGAAWWLAGTSVAFYGWWSWQFVPLLLASVVFNFAAGLAIAKLNTAGRPVAAKGALTVAIVADLTLLGYFKYADFLLRSWNAVSDSSVPLLHIVLPLGISFFTFTQIAYLVDAYRGKAREYDFDPLRAVRHLFPAPDRRADPAPPGDDAAVRQRRDLSARRATNIAVGLDDLRRSACSRRWCSPTASRRTPTPVFDAAAAAPLHLLACLGRRARLHVPALLRFLRLLGHGDRPVAHVRHPLPLNFDSPYKARNIIEFWRRWHMTLSRFLRDYLYIPLGGNRQGHARGATSI